MSFNIRYNYIRFKYELREEYGMNLGGTYFPHHRTVYRSKTLFGLRKFLKGKVRNKYLDSIERKKSWEILNNLFNRLDNK